MLAFFEQFISPGDLCFDVGANVGNRVRMFLKLGANVVAIEPQPNCAAILQNKFGENRHLHIVQKALGESEGEAKMMISNADTISSLSPSWIKAVKQSGRFADYDWHDRLTVPMVTLDSLIEKFGVPTFIKIDVEGSEYQVIKGLSRPVNYLSLEFVPEYVESIFKCIDHLQRFGRISLNYSVGESAELALEQWLAPKEMIELLVGFQDDTKIFGDVYVRFDG